MRQFSHIPQGFRNVYGVTLSPHTVEAYNQLQDRMAQYVKEGRPVPEELLNGSFHLINGAS